MRLNGLGLAPRSLTIQWHVEEHDLAEDTKEKEKKKTRVSQRQRGIMKKEGEASSVEFRQEVMCAGD